MSDYSSILAGFGVVFLLILILRPRFQYHLRKNSLEITAFGVTLRSIPFCQIESVSKRRSGQWGERWWTTRRVSHRLLVIRRKSGWLREISITPDFRYEFRNQLEKVLQSSQEGTGAGERTHPRRHGVYRRRKKRKSRGSPSVLKRETGRNRENRI